MAKLSTGWSLRIAGIVVGMLIATVIVACGNGGRSSESSSGSNTSNDQPRDVNEGMAFTIRDYSIAPGWKIANDGAGGFAAKGVIIKNTSDEADTAYFRLKLLDGRAVIAKIDCNTDEIDAGQEQEANCLDTGMDDLGAPRRQFKTGWDKITVESNP